MDVKSVLKNRRLEKQLTLDDVGRLVGVSAATISRWESGDIANMKRDKIVKLANALEISPAVIMGWEDNGSIQEQYYLNDDVRDLANFLFDNPDYKVLFDASRKVKKEDIEFVRKMIEKMSD